MVDGENFEVGDGANDPVVFEFDLNGSGVTGGNVAIVFTGSEDHVALAALVEAAINGVGTTLGVTASFEGNGGGGEGGASGASNGGAENAGADNGGAESGAPSTSGAQNGGTGGGSGSSAAVVTLVNDSYGSLGNVAIVERAGNPGFKRAGMSGGAAVQCAERPTLCNDDGDCDSTCDTGAKLCE
jgi:hypothetical protein